MARMKRIETEPHLKLNKAIVKRMIKYFERQIADDKVCYMRHGICAALTSVTKERRIASRYTEFKYALKVEPWSRHWPYKWSRDNKGDKLRINYLKKILAKL